MGKRGLIGLSVIRAASVASVPGRPSRLKKEPGIFPIEYIRSSKSTVSGKKSVPGLDSPSQSVVSITVSPYLMVTEASALWASRPIPISKVFPPISREKIWVCPPVVLPVTVKLVMFIYFLTICLIMICFLN